MYININLKKVIVITKKSVHINKTHFYHRIVSQVNIIISLLSAHGGLFTFKSCSHFI